MEPPGAAAAAELESEKKNYLTGRTITFAPCAGMLRLDCCSKAGTLSKMTFHTEAQLRYDLHTHFYTEAYFQTIRDLPSEFSFDTEFYGQTIITYRGARFFGVTPAMTDVAKRIEDMDRVGIDVEVVSLSTPNVFFTTAEHQPSVARMINDSYAELIAAHPTRFKGFASIPMDAPDAAFVELHRAIHESETEWRHSTQQHRGKAINFA